MRPFPVTDGAVEAGMPIEREEQHGTIIVVGEDVYGGVDHAAEDKGQPPMSACAEFVHETPEQDGVDDQRGGRVQEVVPSDPERIVEILLAKGFVHDA